MALAQPRLLLLLGLCLVASAAGAETVVEASPGANVERHLSSEVTPREWSQDPERLRTDLGDRLEEREVLSDQAETVKLTNVVPPIRFASGVADIPPTYVERLRGVLDGMRHLPNVRLHLVGHADDQPLSESLAGVYGDNTGLSEERAGEVAEFLQAALGLPPEAISFSWAGASQPIASNATEEGRALNRRVEVEVWYDEIGKKLSVQDVVIPQEIKRVKVCRTETVCKLRYREGHARRARVRNLIEPFHFGDEGVGVPPRFVRQVDQALRNLRDKQNVTVKFIGFTDDAPLEGRAARIYGTHLALSKAWAHRVALATQDALGLSTSVVASEGRGAALPMASNQTARGRAMNRRVEVEFWHDDPLQELPGDPQPCPDAAGAEVVTQVYDPPWGGIPPLELEDGQPRVPEGYADVLRRAMDDVRDKSNVRLRFVGYTANERLDRRTARAYGDDIGLSTARARRTKQTLVAALGLEETQAEHEGRGYLHAHDVVNAGFVQGASSHVVVQVVYDELALLDDYAGVDITPINRELRPRDPLALNLMRITVDGEPLDDPGRSSADVQRCTDVALERADVRFRFDGLESEPRLSVSSDPGTVRVGADESGSLTATPVRFRMYSNYAHFIERSEVRVFEAGRSLEATPAAVIEMGPDGSAEWRPEATPLSAPVRELQYVLRAYDAEGRFDETAPQQLWMIRGDPRELRSRVEGEEGRRPDPLLAGYGETGALLRNIPLDEAGLVQVEGRGIPPRHTVWLAGERVPVDASGSFVAETLLPRGTHTVEVAVLDESGNGELFLRDLELGGSDWFYMGVADLTLSWNRTGNAADELAGRDALSDYDSLADGRLAFYVNGRFGEGWALKASADTREGPLEDIFTNFLDKAPESLFRRMDPDYHYPTFGDDGTVEETAPTLGKFFVKLERGESHALWGNFKVGYTDNELALVERGLYGANLHYQSPAATSFGERRLVLDGFAADPGTVGTREEFRGTDGSLFFLRRQDILTGSERLRIEVRDKDSGLVTAVKHLRPVLDYDIDYLQGRILLSEPMASTVDDDLVVRSQGLSGDEAWLVVQYEYSPGFDEIDTLAAGGEGQVWVNDFVKLGFTANRNEEDGGTSSLYGTNLTLRKSADSWLKLQAGRSEGLVSTSFRSDDGGFRFLGGAEPGLREAEAGAYRADLSVGFADWFAAGRGRLSFYGQWLEDGYSGPGLSALTDTQQYGGQFQIDVNEMVRMTAKADRLVEDRGLETTTQEVDVAYDLGGGWSVTSGVRNEMREDDSPVVAATQQEGERTDAAVEVAFDPGDRWKAYAFGQATVLKSGDQEANNRGGLGGAYRLNERLMLEGEVSHGDLGPAAKLGLNYQETERTQHYMSYSLDNERGETGLHGRRGNLIQGARSRISDSSSVYVEQRYQHSDSMNGLTRAVGVTLAPSERWTVGTTWEIGNLIDRRTRAETRRKAGGGRVGYRFEKALVSSGIEYRLDETEQPDGSWSERSTWLFRNSFKLQMTPDWRLLGKLNHAMSDSSLGDFYDGGFTEAVLGYAFRPVKHDRLNALAKYTYFFNVPTTDQVTLDDTSSQYLQKSHVTSLDLTYDLTSFWTVGTKYAYRLGQVSLERESPDFFDNNAHLYILRNDFRFLRSWESSVEGRMLALPDLKEQRIGALLAVYRYLGDHFKVGLGYNFTDFSDDLTDLSYDHHGVFFNLVGSL
ncbi:MAG: OmpA family protein [Myxococcota bacterium]|nr:OmpA family protein [Myxococcota bacterium]